MSLSKTRAMVGITDTWKVFLDNYVSDFDGSFLLKCNYDVKFLPKTLPQFSKECLSEWAAYKSRQIITHSDVLLKSFGTIVSYVLAENHC